MRFVRAGASVTSQSPLFCTLSRSLSLCRSLNNCIGGNGCCAVAPHAIRIRTEYPANDTRRKTVPVHCTLAASQGARQ